MKGRQQALEIEVSFKKKKNVTGAHNTHTGESK
jgi:hypothetical protein